MSTVSSKTQSDPLYEELWKAAERGEVAIVTSLLQQGVPPDTYRGNIFLGIWYDTAPALHVACVKGHVTVVDILLAYKADINSTSTDDGYTPLHWACRMGHVECVDRLIVAGCQLNTQETQSGYTPLHRASEEGHVECVDRLIQAGCLLNIQETRWGNTALHKASENGHIDIVRKLLLSGADIHTGTREGSTALHLAAYKGHPAVAILLYEAGAQVTAQDKEEYTPVHVAVGRGRLDMLQVLVERCGGKACLSMMDIHDLTPVQLTESEHFMPYHSDADRDKVRPGMLAYLQNCHKHGSSHKLSEH